MDGDFERIPPTDPDRTPVDELQRLREQKLYDQPHMRDLREFLRAAELCFRQGSMTRGQIAAFLLEASPPTFERPDLPPSDGDI